MLSAAVSGCYRSSVADGWKGECWGGGEGGVLKYYIIIGTTLPGGGRMGLGWGGVEGGGSQSLLPASFGRNCPRLVRCSLTAWSLFPEAEESAEVSGRYGAIVTTEVVVCSLFSYFRCIDARWRPARHRRAEVLALTAKRNIYDVALLSPAGALRCGVALTAALSRSQWVSLRYCPGGRKGWGGGGGMLFDLTVKNHT